MSSSKPRHAIENCAHGSCPMTWEGLEFQARDSESVRMCQACRREVQYCENLDQARFFARSGDVGAAAASGAQTHARIASSDVQSRRTDDVSFPQPLPFCVGPDEEKSAGPAGPGAAVAASDANGESINRCCRTQLQKYMREVKESEPPPGFEQGNLGERPAAAPRVTALARRMDAVT